jgi:hypothetical protein
MNNRQSTKKVTKNYFRARIVDCVASTKVKVEKKLISEEDLCEKAMRYEAFLAMKAERKRLKSK